MLDNIKSYLLNKIGLSSQDAPNSLIESVMIDNDNDNNKIPNKTFSDSEVEEIFNSKNDSSFLRKFTLLIIFSYLTLNIYTFVNKS